MTPEEKARRVTTEVLAEYLERGAGDDPYEREAARRLRLFDKTIDFMCRDFLPNYTSTCGIPNARKGYEAFAERVLAEEANE